MYVIIGQGAAGTAAANELRKLDKDAQITVLTNETDCFYSRIDLPDIVAGKYRPQDAVLQTAEQFKAKEIRCIMGQYATRILPDERIVELSSGQRLGYRKLLLATGARLVAPKLEGITARGVYSLWTMAQAAGIIAAAAVAKSAVVIGAGLIGLKTALALTKRGLRVTVIERMDRVLPQQLDEPGAAIIETGLGVAGVDLLTGVQVDAVETCNGSVIGVRMGRKILACDMVIVAAGTRPNTDLAQASGIKIAAGIITDEYLQTSEKDIYAAGDVAQVTDLISKQSIVSATWPAAVEQGEVAARNMAGDTTPYHGYLTMNSVEIAGIPLVSAGDVTGSDGDEIVAVRNENLYKRLVLRDNVLKGVLLIGDIRQAGVLAGAVACSTNLQRYAPLGASFSFVDLLTL
ncbi:MAG: nasB [Anaerosporomusa subterranea]|jgi:NAD(P)H-nitrite reductase large subunit|nr:nasB [Anaerosporomusa subterranea]